MNLKKFGYILLFLLWLLLMIIPFVSVVLATRGELAVGGESESGFRLFLLQEKEHQGVGFQWRRVSSNQEECLNSSVYYVLWEGSSKDINTTYCQCFDPDTGVINHSAECLNN